MRLARILIAGIVLVVLAGSIWAYLASRAGAAAAAASALNLQQWGIALNLYLIENENQLPETGASPITPDQQNAWYNALPPYVSQSPLADLPPGQRPKPGDVSIWIDPAVKPPPHWAPDVFYFNYAMNAFLQPQADVRSFKINELDHPGNVVFLAEVDAYEPSCNPDTVAYRHGPKPGSARSLANILFCDGHVAMIAKAVLTDDSASRAASNAENGPSWFER